MKLTILGSGTAVPDGARNSSGYFIESGGLRLMLDCGAGTLHALDRYGLPWREMSHLFVSHFHVDHVGELASLFFAFKHALRDERSAPFALIGAHSLGRVTGGLKQAFGEDLFTPKFPVEVRNVAPGDRIELAPDSYLSVAKTPHTEESLAVRVESEGRSICYTGDTSYDEGLAEFFSGADLLVSECSFRERKEGVRHLSIRDAARLAERAKVSRLLVTHFYFPVDEAALAAELKKEFSGQVIIGRDGLGVDL
ncbi:MAG TPA: MBL fold metallo-hydrolase [Blastocatellia bacterium]|jgi:ribonuclease BN (tRNA processing enzyme)|nr:MBL fold metallo-hydrolase [Blastocatellia bacterium]